jgi:hypothetical protein
MHSGCGKQINFILTAEWGWEEHWHLLARTIFPVRPRRPGPDRCVGVPFPSSAQDSWLFTIVLFVLLTTIAHAQTFSVLYNFGSKSGDPLDPGFQGIIAQGRDGNFYSTASNGGTTLSGDVFRITPVGLLTGIHNFDGTMECLPLSGLTLATQFLRHNRGMWHHDVGNRIQNLNLQR